jgi:ATP-binding cassette subfamily F protein 3
MSRITAQSLEKGYGGHELFQGLSFELTAGMRLCVAGPNGCGKSTLLRILAGVARPDAGEFSLSPGARLGYVAQEFDDDTLQTTLLAWVLAVFPSWGGFWDLWERAVRDGDHKALERLGARQEQLERDFGYNPEHKARAVLNGLGFSEDQLALPLKALSGGFRERAKLARVLLQGADVLLLDEPTNHLDLEAIEWLEDYLLNYQGALAFVAHDRIFLDRIATHVLFISGGRHVLRKGNFQGFLDWELEQSVLREKEQAKLSARIDSEMDYIRRFRVKARKAAQAQAKLKRVEKLEAELNSVKQESQAARAPKTLSFSLPAAGRGDKAAITAADVQFSYDGRSLWRPLSFQIFRGQKIALAAPNGVGKTTLLRLITGELTPDCGSLRIGPNTVWGYFSQHRTEILNPDSTVLGELRRLSDPSCTDEQLKGTLGLFLLGEAYFDRPVSRLSGGEKSRLVLASLFLLRAGLLILDEPTNHLDLESREALIQALDAYEGTLLVVAHDRKLLREAAREVWVLGQDGLEVHLGGFEEYDRKRRQEAQEAASAEPSPKRVNLKEKKREAAEIRNRMHREIKPKRDKFEKLEARFESRLAEQSELEEALADPATYADGARFNELHARYQALAGETEKLMASMESLEQEINALEARKNAQLEALDCL